MPGLTRGRVNGQAVEGRTSYASRAGIGRAIMIGMWPRAKIKAIVGIERCERRRLGGHVRNAAKD